VKLRAKVQHNQFSTTEKAEDRRCVCVLSSEDTNLNTVNFGRLIAVNHTNFGTAGWDFDMSEPI